MRAAGLGGERDVTEDWAAFGGGNGVQWVLAVPYIPVQGSPGVFRESWGVGDRVFGWVFVIGGVEVAYVWRIGLLK